MSAAPADFNAQIIAEFRANHGRVGGHFDGATLLLLHTIGARSGRQYTNPVVYLADGGRYVVFASKAGAPSNPGWYHNLKAHPEVSIEVGTRRSTSPPASWRVPSENACLPPRRRSRPSSATIRRRPNG
jgi:deazaflavin-dependent oxidoreductase (nitroreductase family)